MQQPEVWMRGPAEGVPSLLQPAAHALLQAREEVNEIMNNFPDNLLWERPANVASPAFHLQHLSGVINRLLTYAKGEMLNQEQLDALAKEGKEDSSITVAGLLKQFNERIDEAISQLKNTDEKTLTDFRGVGRKQLPSTVQGLLFHAAEHTMRHLGQLLVTVRIIRSQAKQQRGL
ncbi:DinB family protein [Danxiaibacter flavus]|uniref:DinB family protein n=1 Tax=Danxiaibacter flavus TaxID=3049108 RepID=A0ABV3ZBU8_9BACT|nr:DinB family protein [Chitinophagaceae bacterium DXS]